MVGDKLPKPLAACNVCHALTNLHEEINHRCSQVVHGRRCYGTFKSAITYLWDACESCDATGKVGTQTCDACAGFGWRMYG
jgi:DnaJ-class molecular chaperone